MYGLEAIQAHNGWAMAITGAFIVMVGLSILSFIISQLHRIVEFVDSRTNKKTTPNQTSSSQPQVEKPAPLSDLNETMKRFRPLTQEIGNPFDLASLFQVFLQHDDPHPHLTIRSLREQGYLKSDGGGLFTWKHS